MKFTYKPQNHTPEELLIKAGFVSVNRGWALLRTGRKGRTKPVQIHAIVDHTGEIDLHADIMIDNKHVTNKNELRMNRFIGILKAADEGADPILGKLILKKYAGLQKLIHLGTARAREDVEKTAVEIISN